MFYKGTTPVRISRLTLITMMLYKAKWFHCIVLDEWGGITIHLYNIYYNRFLSQRLPGEIINDTIIRKLTPTMETKMYNGDESGGWTWAVTILAVAVVFAVLLLPTPVMR